MDQRRRCCMRDLSKPQVMDRPRKSTQNSKAQEAGRKWVEQLEKQLEAATSQFDEALATLPVPHRRVERWKYTPVNGWWRAIGKRAQITAKQAGCEPCPIPGLDAYRLVFVNGEFDAEASDLPVYPGIVCSPLSLVPQTDQAPRGSNSLEQEDWFAALNGKFAKEGLFLRIGDGISLDRPLLVHHHSTGEGCAAFLRHDIEIGVNAEIKLIHWSTASQPSRGVVNISTKATVGSNGRFQLDKVQDEEGHIQHMAFEEIQQAQDSRVDVYTMTIRGQWVRNDASFRLDGKGAHAELNGIYLPDNTEFVDNHTTVDHRAAHCTSSEHYKGILYGKSTGVFNGKVFVRPDAQQTNAYQQNANILVSNQATMNAKPELEIYADDVKCSHGCTIGQFDEEALFYAQSRGVGVDAAKAMLVHAFIDEILDGVAVHEVRLEVNHRLAEKHQWTEWSDHLE